jgi:hypothetical protein
MKSYDLAEKPSEMGLVSSSKKTKYYPTMRLTAAQFPPLKGWKVGEEYDLHVTVRQQSYNEEKDGKASASFEIVSAAPMGEQKDTEGKMEEKGEKQPMKGYDREKKRYME